MKLILEPIAFLWDTGNSDKNVKKHNVINQEAEQVFRNKPIFIFTDEKHSLVEKRKLVWGMTGEKRTLAIIFTIREKKVRIISARDMNKKERRIYEEKLKSHTDI